MAIIFTQKNKRQKYLILVFFLIILAIILILCFNFFVKSEETVSPMTTSPLIDKSKRIEINFDVLKNPLLEELQPFEEIAPFEEEPGRANPFLPY